MAHGVKANLHAALDRRADILGAQAAVVGIRPGQLTEPVGERVAAAGGSSSIACWSRSMLSAGARTPTGVSSARSDSSRPPSPQTRNSRSPPETERLLQGRPAGEERRVDAPTTKRRHRVSHACGTSSSKVIASGKRWPRRRSGPRRGSRPGHDFIARVEPRDVRLEPFYGQRRISSGSPDGEALPMR